MRRLAGMVLFAAILAEAACAAVVVETNRVAAASLSTLPEVVVTATRRQCEMQSVPATVHVIDVQRGIEAGARTTPELLAGVPSVLVQKTAYGQGSPFLRGFTGFRTLFMIDGVRLNNSVFRDGPNQYWNTVDPLSLAGCELVMGPASVLFGSDAVGGTVNAYPAAPSLRDDEFPLGGRVLYRAATAEDSHVFRVELEGRPTDGFSFIGGVSFKAFGDLRGGREVGVQDRTGYGETDFDFRADWRVSPYTAMTLVHQNAAQDDVWRTHKTVYGIDWEGLSVGDEKKRSLDQDRDLTYVRFRHDSSAGFVDSLECTLSRHVQAEDQYRVKSNDSSDDQKSSVETWGLGVQCRSESGIGELVYGAECYLDDVDSGQRAYNADGSLKSVGIQGPVADDASYGSLGVYVQDRVTLPGGLLEVIPGLRYSSFEADADRALDPVSGGPMSVAGRWDAVTAACRLLCPLSRDRRHVLFAALSQGFRAPNLSDLTRLDTARSNEIETPSPDLDPEDYICGEIGYRVSAGRIRAQAACYYTAIDGMIVRTPTGRVIDGDMEVTKKNSGAGYVSGAEISAVCDISPNWSVRASGSVMDGRVDGYPTSADVRERDYISRLMPPTAELGLRWHDGSGKRWVELAADLASKASKLSADDERDTQRIPPGGTPGYAVFHVRSGVRLSDAMTIWFAVENVFDDDYRIHGSGVNEPGLNVVLTASRRF